MGGVWGNVSEFIHAFLSVATDPPHEFKIGHLNSTPIYGIGPQEIIMGPTG
jgi:hypothetical protein